MPALKSGLVYAAACILLSAARWLLLSCHSRRRHLASKSPPFGETPRGALSSTPRLKATATRERICPSWTYSLRFISFRAHESSAVPIGSTPKGLTSPLRRKVRCLILRRFRCCDLCWLNDSVSVVHNELRDGDVYDLSLARDDGTLGPMLRVSAYDCDEQRKRIALGSAASTDAADWPCPFSNYPGNFIATSITMAGVAAMLNIYTGSRPIRDRTGLTSL